nr:hypothetical protein [Tanacetum cinerariifolium]
MSNLSGVKKLLKGLSDRFDEYERSKVCDAKRVLEKELVNERNAKEFYREFGEYMCRMLQNHQKSEGSFPLPLGSQVREPPTEPSARPVPAPYLDDPYVVTRDAAIATSSIDDDDDDTAPMDSQPHEPLLTMPPRKSTRGNPPPPLTQDTMNRMIQESVEATIRAKRERVQMKQIMLKDLTSGPDLVELTSGYFGNRSCNQENVGRNEGDVTEEFCPLEEIQRMEREVTSSEPATLSKAMRMALTLMEQKVKAKAEREADNKKRKWENFQGGSSRNNNSNQNNNNYNSNPRDCWSKVVATGVNAQPVVTCYGCGEKGHIKTNCPARNNPGRNEACGQAYALRDGDQNLGPNVVT